MGRLLHVEPCPVCNYHIEGPLHYGGSTRSHLFIHHRYILAHCLDCANIVSVLVPTPEYDLPQVLAAARADITELEARVSRGDVFARILLPIHRAALLVEDEQPPDLRLCTVCGSANVILETHVGGDDGERFDGGHAWMDCPRCEDGRLMLKTIGTWDEIDDAP